MQVQAGDVEFGSPHLNSQEHKLTQGGSSDERRGGLKSGVLQECEEGRCPPNVFRGRSACRNQLSGYVQLGTD